MTCLIRPQQRLEKLFVVSFDGTLAGGLLTSRETVVSVLPKVIHGDHNKILISVNGVGSGIGPVNRLIGGLCGWGTLHNVVHAYKNIAEQYAQGDRIILCGYSRGAWSARYLAMIIDVIGLPIHCDNEFFRLLYQQCKTDPNFKKDVHQNLSAYERWAGVTIDALCCFDTVGSLGLPLFGIAKPLSLFRRGTRMEDIVSDVASNVRYSFHALSLHETREPFSPTYMRGPNVHQVFFVGNHGDMGWVNKHESFVHAPLSWMIQQLESHLNIVFDENGLQKYFPSYRSKTTPPQSLSSLPARSDVTEDLRQGAITTSPSTDDRDYPWATGRVSRTSSTLLVLIGKKVRRPEEIMGNHGKRGVSPMRENMVGNRLARPEMADNDTSVDVEAAHLNVQVHIGARIYKESNAVPGYAIRVPTTGQFYWARQGSGQQAPWGTWFLNLHRSSSNGSESQSPEQNRSECPVIRSKRIARLSGHGATGSGPMVVERIQEAAVGPREAALLGLEAAVVSMKPCSCCSGSSWQCCLTEPQR